MPMLRRDSWPVITLILVLLVTLLLLGEALQNSAAFKQYYSLFFTTILIGILALVVVVVYSGINLLRRLRERQPGSRLRLRLIVVFVSLSILPLISVFYFSANFLHQGIDSWFDVENELAMEQALELSQVSIDLQLREFSRRTDALVDTLSKVPIELAQPYLEEMIEEHHASEVSIYDRQGKIVVFSQADGEHLTPLRPSDSALFQSKQSDGYIGLVPSGQHHLDVMAVKRIAYVTRSYVIVCLYPLPERVGVLAQQVQDSYQKHQQLSFLREPLKQLLLFTLTLALVLSVLSAIWAALYFAERITEPVTDLIVATQAVSLGDYSRQLVAPVQDDLGLLVVAFNEMTRRISLARDDTRKSQEELEAQRHYLESVLGRLSTGVLSFDGNQILRIINPAAAKIMKEDLNQHLGMRLASVVQLSNGRFGDLMGRLSHHIQGDQNSWEEQVVLTSVSNRLVLSCRGGKMGNSARQSAGYVVTFDDITQRVQAEKDAAWSEVARRMAHEIKNPLTPIRLAAERLQHKYLKTMSHDDGIVLERSTRTIVSQVDAMKKMVDAFSEYAQVPKVVIKLFSISRLIEELVELYRQGNSELDIIVDLDSKASHFQGDEDKLRQIFHNVFKNSLEALETVEKPRIEIESWMLMDGKGRTLEICFSDNGPGFGDDETGQLLEPYVTKKPKGSGLGLAIVRKIVEEHSGVISLENRREGGARVVMRFPFNRNDSNKNNNQQNERRRVP